MQAKRPTPDTLLQPGEFYFGSGQQRVRTLLGSCVAIVLWHRSRKIGGMCHYLLPTRGKPRAASAPLDGRYADEAFALFFRELRSTRTQASDYVAKLFGGGRMFPEHSRSSACGLAECTAERSRECGDVACKNIQAGRELLTRHGFALTAEHVGGMGYRQLVFDLMSGDVWVRRGAKAARKAVTGMRHEAN